MRELPSLPELVVAGFDSLPVAIIGVIPKGIVGYMNDSARSLVGGDRIGQPVDEIVPESARRGHHAHRAKYGENPVRRPMGDGRALEAQPIDGDLILFTVGAQNRVPTADRPRTARWPVN